MHTGSAVSRRSICVRALTGAHRGLGQRSRLIGSLLLAVTGAATFVASARTGPQTPQTPQPPRTRALAEARLVGQSVRTTQTPVTIPLPLPVPLLGGSPRPEAQTPLGAGTYVAATSSPASAPPSAAGPLLYTANAEVSTLGLPQTVTPQIEFLGPDGSVLDVVSGQPLAATSTFAAIHPVVALSPAGTSVAKLLLACSDYPALRIQRPTIRANTVDDPPVVGPLHTEGNHIVDATGSDVILRGVTYAGLLDRDASTPTYHEFLEVHAWGANVVRVALNQALWLTTSCLHDPGYESEVDEVVHWITSLGMMALLDLHYSDPFQCLPAGPEEMADSPGSVEFWSQVASRYGTNPLVAFDLYNEPHDISDSVWLDGGSASAWAPYRAAGMQQLYDAIRAKGAGNLVFASGNNWGVTYPSMLINGTNVVYSVHAYTCSYAPPPQCPAQDPYDPSSILDPWVGPSTTEPVVVGEFGWPSTSDGTFTQNVVDFAQAHGWGWTAFAWDGSVGGPYDLVAQNPPDGTWEPTPTSMPILAALAQGGRPAGAQ